MVNKCTNAGYLFFQKVTVCLLKRYFKKKKNDSPRLLLYNPLLYCPLII